MTDKILFNENGNLHYSVQGEGSPAVLVHGFAASNYDWVYLTPDLINCGYQVIAPDLIGHGNSNFGKSTDGYTFDVLYQHFADWIDSLNFDQKLTLIGHSMGGLITLNYALQNPDKTHNMVLIDPYFDKNQLNPLLRFISRRPGWYQKALELAPQWLIHFIISLDIEGFIHYDDRTRKQIAADYKRASPEIIFIPDSIPDISGKLSQIQSPTLVIWGTRDATINTNSFPALVNSLPNGTGKTIPGTGHQPHLANKKQFNQIVTDYLFDNSGM